MAKPPLPESPTQRTDEVPLEDSFYEIPPELEDGGAPSRAAAAEPDPTDDEESPRPKPRFPVALVSAGALAAICIVGGLVAYRCHGQRKVVREGIAQAERLMALDTAEGYRKAASLLTPLTRIDPLQAGSARAFALAMLACDYRDAEADEEANRLLVVPGRADRVPPYASLAFRVLALGRGALADAALDRAGESAAEQENPAEPWGKAINARVALAAGTYESALEDATAAAAVPGFVAGLAVHGDTFRRARRDYRTALSSYEAALAASPTHPRAAFGLAKLALSGQAPEAEARAALGRILSTGEATPRRERARAVLHLAALRIRAQDPVDAVRQELGAGFNARELDWLMGAARAEAANRGAYRAVADAPATLQSSNDDDLEDKAFHPLSPEPPPPPPPPPPIVEKPAPARPPPHAAKPARHEPAAKQHGKPTHGGKAAPAKTAKASKVGAGKSAGKAAVKKASSASKASPKKKPRKASR